MCTFIKTFIGYFRMAIFMYVLYENTYVYGIQVESFFRDL